MSDIHISSMCISPQLGRMGGWKDGPGLGIDGCAAGGAPSHRCGSLVVPGTLTQIYGIQGYPRYIWNIPAYQYIPISQYTCIPYYVYKYLYIYIIYINPIRCWINKIIWVRVYNMVQYKWGGFFLMDMKAVNPTTSRSLCQSNLTFILQGSMGN